MRSWAFDGSTQNNFNKKGNKTSFCDYLIEGDSFNDIEGVFPSFDSKGVLLVPDPNQSQTRKGKVADVPSKHKRDAVAGTTAMKYLVNSLINRSTVFREFWC